MRWFCPCVTDFTQHDVSRVPLCCRMHQDLNISLWLSPVTRFTNPVLCFVTAQTLSSGIFWVLIFCVYISFSLLLCFVDFPFSGLHNDNSVTCLCLQGGCVDSTNQSLALLLMTLGQQDVSKVLLGPLSPYT